MAHRLRMRAALASFGVGVALFALAGPASANGTMPPTGGGGGCGSGCGGGGGTDGGTITITPSETPAPPEHHTPPESYTPPQHHDPAPPTRTGRPPTSPGRRPEPLTPAEPWTAGAPEDVPPADPTQDWVAATPNEDAPTPQLGLAPQQIASDAQLPRVEAQPGDKVAGPPPLVIGGGLAALALLAYVLWELTRKPAKPVTNPVTGDALKTGTTLKEVNQW